MAKNIRQSLDAIRGYLIKADNIFYEDLYNQRYENADQSIEYYIEKSFMELLVILDSEGLERTYNEVKGTLNKARSSQSGLKRSLMGPDEPYLFWPDTVRNYLTALTNINNIKEEHGEVEKDLIEALRHSIYSITDLEAFPNSPSDEKEVQHRIECILKCFYHDLIHEPTLTKPIKNFRPDTGLPSLKTLIEYKFISSVGDAKRVVDEVLADTRAYKSKDWSKFIFVIYETKRVKPEKEWKQLIRACGTARNTDVIVLLGEPPKKRRKTARRN